MRHCLVLIVLLAVLSSAPAAAEVVKLGLVGGGGNAGIFLADEEGYFAAEGLELEITRFDAAAKMMAPLGTGELDVAVGAVSASFFNAIERKVDIKVIASLAQTVANDPYYALVVRKDLVDSGRFKSYADLKGLRAALGAPGVGVSSLLDSAAKAGGIQFSDIETVYLPMPQQVVAMQKGLIDATYIVDPFGSEMVSDGAGVRFASADAVYPHYQIAVFFCNEAFLQRPGQAIGLAIYFCRCCAARPSGRAAAFVIAGIATLADQQGTPRRG
jgi:NitT/TauT family transport system substrate-binding protein